MTATVDEVVETTVRALGLELVDLEVAQRGKLLRIFIDRPGASPADPLSGIAVADCERVTRQLQRVLPVEGIDYDRLEVSSPGLDRALKRAAEFEKFKGFEAEVRVRVPQAGRRKFVGVLRGCIDGVIQLEAEGVLHALPLADLERARLVPQFPTPGGAKKPPRNQVGKEIARP